jgi:glycosyltransferase involved in cell wall biosynthesis
MSCGCVVLGADVPGIHDIIHDGVNGFLCAPDALSLAAALQRIDVLPDVSSFGIQARKTILDNNTLAAQVARELLSLQKLLR